MPRLLAMLLALGLIAPTHAVAADPGLGGEEGHQPGPTLGGEEGHRPLMPELGGEEGHQPTGLQPTPAAGDPCPGDGGEEGHQPKGEMGGEEGHQPTDDATEEAPRPEDLGELPETLGAGYLGSGAGDDGEDGGGDAGSQQGSVTSSGHAGCQSLTFEGACDEGVLRWCDDGGVARQDVCGRRGEICAYDGVDGYFACLDPRDPAVAPPGEVVEPAMGCRGASDASPLVAAAGLLLLVGFRRAAGSTLR